MKVLILIAACIGFMNFGYAETNKANLPCWGAAGAPHVNGGGFVAETAFAQDTAYVGKFAQVCGDSQILQNASVYGNARIFNSVVKNEARVSGKTSVQDSFILDKAKVYSGYINNSTIKNNTKVYNGTIEYSQVRSSSIIGNSILGPRVSYSSVVLSKGGYIVGRSKVWSSNIFNKAKLNDNSHVFDSTINASSLRNETIVRDSYVQGIALAGKSEVSNSNINYHGKKYVAKEKLPLTKDKRGFQGVFKDFEIKGVNIGGFNQSSDKGYLDLVKKYVKEKDETKKSEEEVKKEKVQE